MLNNDQCYVQIQFCWWGQKNTVCQKVMFKYLERPNLNKVHSVYYYTMPLSPLCRLVWRHWTYTMLVIYILSSVWVCALDLIHFLNHILCDIRGRMFSVRQLLFWWLWEYLQTYFIFNSEIRIISHCWGSGLYMEQLYALYALFML